MLGKIRGKKFLHIKNVSVITSVGLHKFSTGLQLSEYVKNDQNGENYQKSALKIFLVLTSPNCKVSEKINERFPRKSVTYGETRLLRPQMTSWRYQKPQFLAF